VAIAAHSDDIENWCAGTLAVAINRGATVRLLLATSGDKGTCDPSATRQQVAALLEGEARDAASLLGTVSPSCSPTIPNTLILPT